MRLDISSASHDVYALQIPTPGLGDHSYLLFVGDAVVAVDPQRDIDRFEEAIADHAGHLVAVVETHVHNDYISGGAILAARHSARYVLPAESGSTVDHVALGHGERLVVADGWDLEAIHTPGHTPHHNAYALVGPETETMVFTGGSMLVGAVGRSDLVSPELTERLARSQFSSVRRLAAQLPDPMIVGPTHGAGSFCSASNVADTVSTIAAERLRNPALLTDDVDEFVTTQLAGYRIYPTYYRHMGATNAAGVDPIPTDPIPELTSAEIDAFEGTIVDLRSAEEFAARHLPGSVNIPAHEQVAVYAGWVLPWNSPVALVGSDDEVANARIEFGRIGWDRIEGKITDGLASWTGIPADYRVATFTDLVAEQPAVVVDVRDPLEFAEGSVPGAIGIHMSQIPGRVAELPEGEVWVYCQTGYRATVSAGFIEASGRMPVLVKDDFAKVPQLLGA